MKAIERNAGPPAVEGWLCHTVSPGQWFMVAGDRRAAPGPGSELTDPGFDPVSGHLTVDVSAAWQCLRIVGCAARTLTAKGTAVDLDPSVFAPGDWRSCRFGHYRVHLHLLSDTEIDLYFERSIAPAFEGFILGLGMEFNISIEDAPDG